MPPIPAPGQLPEYTQLADIPKLITAYFTERPQSPVAFGTSGHRGSSLKGSFNEWHILATTQAIVEYRAQQGVSGPLFIGIDTHALSEPALASALEILSANGVETMVSEGTPYTPTPAISFAILTYNCGRQDGLADGIVVTPSHNPPEDGGFKYNPPNGGPAGSEATSWIENRANELLRDELREVRRVSHSAALNAPSTHRHDYLTPYVEALGEVLDLDAIRGVSMGVDPLGGAGVHYWPRIAERYKLDLTVLSEAVDPTFRFMSLDWDGRIRMDPSSAFAMQRLIGLKDRFDVAFGCDTDHDRHGIVTREAGLLPPNHYLSVCSQYLFSNRPGWSSTAAIGKTLVSSSMLDRVGAGLGRTVFEVPVGFKWFVDGLCDGSLGFVGEESAGASFLRRNGQVWSTDKDGIIAALLAGEITARTGKDPGLIYQDLTAKYGHPAYARLDAPATHRQKAILAKLSPSDVTAANLAGEPIEQKLTKAPGNHCAIGGLKVTTKNGWFAARPSGTEEIYKIYAESFLGSEHLLRIQSEAKEIVSQAFHSAAFL